eukprot:gnl/MRDRNA2_/MRDRNA2_70545_c0_seq1.p1 gnl/MRDRNA2_/MRDRNA2_70545_c0~~gnl/MRDRNA2_/MRDRNA2_70545_c0_seq1.p1  ORF type:complete len:436 (+),score=49.63 gnl/MRDRNA2_/MRDRNA2_70545_c0_seq1:93-1400(+)
MGHSWSPGAHCIRPVPEEQLRISHQDMFNPMDSEQVVCDRPECCSISASLADDSAVIAAGFNDGSIAMFQWAIGSSAGSSSSSGGVKPRVHTGAIHSICYRADLTALGDDHAFLYSGGSDGKLVLTDTDSECQTLSRVYEWQGHSKLSIEASQSGVTAIDVDRDFIVTGGADSSACVWKRLENSSSLEQVQILRRYDGVHGGAITAAAVSELSPLGGSSPLVVTGGEDGFVQLWGIEIDHKKLFVKAGPIMCLELDTNFGRLCTGTRDATVRLYDMSTCKCTRRFQRAPTLKTLIKTVHSISFDKIAVANSGQGGETLVTGGLSDGEVCIWDTRSDGFLKCLTRHFAPVSKVLLQSSLLLSASLDGDMHVWDIRNFAQPLMYRNFCIDPPTQQPLVLWPVSDEVATIKQFSSEVPTGVEPRRRSRIEQCGASCGW